jgi:hypothetical protein
MSVKANDIRQNNYHVGKPFRIPRMGIYSDTVDGVEYVAITTYGVHLVELGELKFDPILITETWLKRFGFEWKSKASTHTGYGIIYIKNNWHISVYPNNDYRVFINGHSILTTDCKYVHQLQNLYYALTGTELVLQKKLIKVN